MSPAIMVVNPNTTAAMTAAAVATAQAVAAPGTRVVGGRAASGPATVESHSEEALGTLSVLEQVRAGEAAGVDAYVIACFGDTGLHAAREVAAGPVVGMSEAALMAAALLAHRFTVVTTPRRTIAQSDRVVRDLGLGHRCSVRAVDVPVADLAPAEGTDAEDAALLALITAEAQRAVDDEAAEALVLGCAGLGHLVAPLEAALGIPVVEGVAAATAMASALLACGLRTSRAGAYAGPVRSATTSPTAQPGRGAA